MKQLRKFVYTSSHLEGEVTLGYDKETLYLSFFDVSKATLTKEQHVSFLRNFPFTLPALNELIAGDKVHRSLTEIKEVITFEMFWDKYNHKVMSNKKKALKIWEKMTEAQQFDAYSFLTTYEKEISKSGIAKKHAETYLNWRI